MSDFRGVIYRDEDGTLMMLVPHEGRATGVTDPNGVYANLADENMDVVEVTLDPLDDSKYSMQSMRMLGWMKPPAGLEMAPVQALEWPGKAHLVVDYIMAEPERVRRFIELIYDDTEE